MSWDLSDLINNDIQRLVHAKLAGKTIRGQKEPEPRAKQLIKKFSEVS